MLTKGTGRWAVSEIFPSLHFSYVTKLFVRGRDFKVRKNVFLSFAKFVVHSHS